MATRRRRGSSSVGRASACHAEGRGFESRLPLRPEAGLVSPRPAFSLMPFPAAGRRRSRMETKPEAVTGLILAGGESRRFGADKARHPVGGRPMIERVYAAVAAEAGEVLVS